MKKFLTDPNPRAQLIHTLEKAIEFTGEPNTAKMLKHALELIEQCGTSLGTRTPETPLADLYIK